jgi:hypothetical protein
MTGFCAPRAAGQWGGRRLLGGRGRGLLLLKNSDGTMPLIFAAGPVGPDGALHQHYTRGSGAAPLALWTAPSNSTASG